ncbi:MAG: hypothetical protein IJ608_10840 [Lachnospiraceae bacterium]|nr:hypothetical protein [Lachnospiraceae bacterium]
MILTEPIELEKLKEISKGFYPDRIKFCIDRIQKKVAIDEEMHIDMEWELIDAGANQNDIFGGDILLDPISVIWESHPNIERNRILHTGYGRKLEDEKLIDELFEILKYWVR